MVSIVFLTIKLLLNNRLRAFNHKAIFLQITIVGTKTCTFLEGVLNFFPIKPS